MRENAGIVMNNGRRDGPSANWISIRNSGRRDRRSANWIRSRRVSNRVWRAVRPEISHARYSTSITTLLPK